MLWMVVILLDGVTGAALPEIIDKENNGGEITEINGVPVQHVEIDWLGRGTPDKPTKGKSFYHITI